MPQDNSWKQSWAEFFAENKLRHVGRYIASKRDDAATRVLVCVLDHVADVVVPRLLGDGHLGGGSNIKPSLVHGDLWSGNKARGMIKSRCDKIEEYAFDAPCFYAHSEYDLAPMRMFGGFPTAFFTEYHLLVPKTEPVEEYDSRMELYQL